jgi:DNA/RNA endonuclease G (NUC1)
MRAFLATALAACWFSACPAAAAPSPTDLLTAAAARPAPTLDGGVGLPVDGDLVEWRGAEVCYDRQLRLPRWAFEDLTPELVGGNAQRKCDFSEPVSVPKKFRRPSSDFGVSGFDRGHLAPAEDFAGDQSAENATFTTANIAPQNSALNRGLWAQLEKRGRQLAVERGEAWVYTAPIYGGDRSGKIAVPSAWCKSILYSSVDAGGATFVCECYVAPNEAPQPGAKLDDFRVSLDALELAAGVTLWGGLPQAPIEAGTPAVKAVPP